jgi:hypothetical protein
MISFFSKTVDRRSAPDRPRLILHIGSTKTGSSYLQNVLYLNRRQLRQQGVLYPDVGVRSSAHHLLAACIHPSAHNLHPDVDWSDKGKMLQEFYREIEQEQKATRAKAVVISSEYLWAPLAENQLNQLFPNVDIEIICFVRDQVEWIPSTYGQAVKTGEARPFDVWLDQKLNAPGFSANYANILAHYEKALHNPVIKAIDYKSALAAGGVCEAFFSRAGLGVNTSRLKLPDKKINPSLGAIGTALLREANRFSLTDAQRNYLLRLLLKVPLDAPSHGVANAEQIQRMLDAYSEQNSTLEKYFEPQHKPKWILQRS